MSLSGALKVRASACPALLPAKRTALAGPINLVRGHRPKRRAMRSSVWSGARSVSPGGTYPGQWSGDDLPFRRQCRWRTDGGLVRVTAIRRSLLRDGQGWLGSAVGSVLAESSLLKCPLASLLTVRLARDTIAIAIHTFPISGLPPIDRSNTGCVGIVTAVIVG